MKFGHSLSSLSARRTPADATIDKIEMSSLSLFMGPYRRIKALEIRSGRVFSVLLHFDHATMSSWICNGKQQVQESSLFSSALRTEGMANFGDSSVNQAWWGWEKLFLGLLLDGKASGENGREREREREREL